jgi:hypothetical protein
VKSRRPGPVRLPAVVHPKMDEHSGSAPADLVGDYGSLPRLVSRARNGRTISSEGTVTRVEYYALLGLPVPS